MKQKIIRRGGGSRLNALNKIKRMVLIKQVRLAYTKQPFIFNSIKPPRSLSLTPGVIKQIGGQTG